MSAVEWFVESATPRPDLDVWHVNHERDMPVIVASAVVMVLERLYPVERTGRRIPGCDWIDSRVRFLDMDAHGHMEPPSDAADFYGLFPASMSPTDVRAGYAEWKRSRDGAA